MGDQAHDTAVDEAKLEQFMGQMAGYMTGGALCSGVWLGDELGLYRTLTDIGPAAADELLVEPYALDDRADNIGNNPMAALLYTASSSICTPNSLSQEVGLGLGAQAGEAACGRSSSRRATRGSVEAPRRRST